MATFIFSGIGQFLGGFDNRLWAGGGGSIIGIIQANFSASHSPTHVTYGSGANILTANGSFPTFDANGDPTSGTIQSFTQTGFDLSGSLTANVTGLSLSVATVNTWIAAGNADALNTALIGGDDTITGTSAPDILYGYGGGDTINGGDGDDEIRGESLPDPFPNYGVAGNDTLNGGAGNDQIWGDDGNDTIDGGDGNDQLRGGAGNDVLMGGNGDDNLFCSGGTVDGGAGFDGLSIDKSTTTAALSINLNLNFALGATVGGVAFVGVETLAVFAGSGADEFALASDVNRFHIDGGGGMDRLALDFSALSSALIIIDSSISYNALTSSFNNFEKIAAVGGVGNDVLWGLVGDDVLEGGAGDDFLSGREGHNLLSAGSGNDTAFYFLGVDQIDGGAGVDTLQLNLSNLATGANISLVQLSTQAGITLSNGTLFRNFERLGNSLLSPGADVVTIDYGSAAFFAGNSCQGGAGQDVLIIDFSTAQGSVSFVNSTLSGAGLPSSAGFAEFEQIIATGGAAGDILEGRTGNNNLFGGAGADTLIGNLGNDFLDGGLGADILRGGAGNDTYVVDNIGDVINPGAPIDAGIDSVLASVSWVLSPEVGPPPEGIENLTLTGIDAISGFGNGLNNILSGNDAANQLGGGGGNDQLFGNAGDDILIGGAGADALDGGLGLDTASYAGGSSVTIDLIAPGSNTGDAAGDTYASIEQFEGSGNADTLRGDDLANVLSGGAGGDTLLGRAGDDTLLGGAGADSLDGGAGADVLIGGAGNDAYLVDTEIDIITELAGEGIDAVNASATYFLFDNVENLTLTGAAAINGSGNALANVIIGNGAVNQLFGLAGNDTLDGGGGADSLFGGLGDDLYIVDNAADFAFEGNVAWGVDLVQASVSYALGQNIDNLTLVGAALVGNGNLLANVITGNANANTLFGMAGNDTLNGGGGADQMFGGLGDDLYIVDDAADFTFEAQSSWGIDTVQTSVDYQLGQNIDNLVLQAGAGALTGRGNLLANTLTGNESANTLFGFAGNDTLDGGAGADQLYGREGDDAYIVDNLGDVVAEANAAWGTDAIFASVTYFLSPNIEHLTLTGAGNINGNGNGLNNTLTGNSGANNLFGQLGNDVLDGGAGADALFGGEGDDTYIVDNAGDVGFEANAAWGIDLVQASVSHALGTNLDNLTLTGAAAINATGNGLANVINGNSAANQLFGLGGADTLNGGAGNDALDGGAGDDAFVFAPGSGSDTVSGFIAGGVEDSINLSAYNGAGVTWTITQSGADTVFAFSNGDQITLTNVTAANLVQTDPFGYS